MLEFILYMAFQELEWHTANDVISDDAETVILDIVHESGRNPCLRWYRTSLDKGLAIMTCFAF